MQALRRFIEQVLELRVVENHTEFAVDPDRQAPANAARASLQL